MPSTRNPSSTMKLLALLPLAAASYAAKCSSLEAKGEYDYVRQSLTLDYRLSTHFTKS